MMPPDASSYKDCGSSLLVFTSLVRWTYDVNPKFNDFTTEVIVMPSPCSGYGNMRFIWIKVWVPFRPSSVK